VQVTLPFKKKDFRKKLIFVFSKMHKLIKKGLLRLLHCYKRFQINAVF